jgi:hypothetical protein
MNTTFKKALQMGYVSSQFLDYKPPMYETQQDKPKTVEEEQLEMNDLTIEDIQSAPNSPKAELTVEYSSRTDGNTTTEIFENSGLWSEEKKDLNESMNSTVELLEQNQSKSQQ